MKRRQFETAIVGTPFVIENTGKCAHHHLFQCNPLLLGHRQQNVITIMVLITIGKMKPPTTAGELLQQFPEPREKEITLQTAGKLDGVFSARLIYPEYSVSSENVECPT